MLKKIKQLFKYRSLWKHQKNRNKQLTKRINRLTKNISEDLKLDITNEEIEEIENTLKVSKPYNELGTYNYFNCESIEKLLEENKSLQSQLKAKEEVIKEAREYVEKHRINNPYHYEYNCFMGNARASDLLEILSKGENK